MNIHIFTLVLSLLFGGSSDSSDYKWKTEANQIENSISSANSDPEHQGEDEELEDNN